MPTRLVTGANRGIGLAFVRHYRERGDEVIAVCREPGDALRATGATVVEGVDVTDAHALDRLSRQLGDTRIDTLINNAGILRKEALGEIDTDGFEAIRRQFEVNAIGPLRVTQALAGHLGEGSKVGIVTSRMGSIQDNGSGGYYGYRMSKAAVNAAGKSLANDLRPRGIAVFLLHPGYVATDMVGGSGDISPEVAAKRLIERLDQLGLDQTGTFWHGDGSPLPW
jgi:NAD(P)-dependent dehydrogenase (short-subunit alcohol dehydrogenase family)